MSRRAVLTLVIALVMTLSIVVGGCGTPAPPPPPPGEGPIVIGAVFNATGWTAAYDQPARQAALLAIRDINEKGGVLGRELQLIELDGKSDPVTVGNAAVQLIERGADVIIAPCDFDIGSPASIAAQDAGLVGVFTCATSPLAGSEALGDKQFTVGMWNNIMGAAMAQYGYDELGWRTAYVIVDTSIDYTLSLGDYFAEHFEALGGQVLGRDTFTAGDEDFSAQVQRIRALAEEPDVLYITGIMPDLGIILRQVRAAGIEVPMAGGDTYDDTELYGLLGKEQGNNIYMVTHSWLGPETGPEMVRFMELYEAEYGEPPVSAFIVMGWDAVKVLAEAIEAAGTTDGAAVAKAMAEMQFELLSGTLTWTSAEEGHQPLKAAAIVELQGGEPNSLGWVHVESPPEP